MLADELLGILLRNVYSVFRMQAWFMLSPHPFRSEYVLSEVRCVEPGNIPRDVQQKKGPVTLQTGHGGYVRNSRCHAAIM